MAFVAAFLMAAMMVVITLDVVLRNLGYQSSAHFFTFTEYALLIVPVPRRALAGAREGPYLRRDPADAARAAARARRMTLAIGAGLHRGLPGHRLVRLRRSRCRDFLQNEKDVRSLDMPRWMVVGWIPLSFLMMAIEFARFLWRRENFLAPLAELAEH